MFRLVFAAGIVSCLVVACPVLAKYGGGSGTAEAPYEIHTPEQMNSIGLNEDDWDKHFILMQDIDLGQYTGDEYNIIGSWVHGFTGVFDGNGHTISNFSYNFDNPFVGLFGQVADRDLGLPGEIRSLQLTAADVTGRYRVGGMVTYLAGGGIIRDCSVTGRVSGHSEVGGLVGTNLGEVTNCRVTNCLLEAHKNCGGIAGYNTGKMTYCYSAVSATGTGDSIGGLSGGNSGVVANCCTNSSVRAHVRSGGLVGLNWGGTIRNCYAIGHASGDESVGGLVGDNWEGTISNCYAAGSVAIDESYLGGLLGENRQGVIASSFWDAQASGVDRMCGRTLGASGCDNSCGKTTEEMRQQATFVSWDFTRTWYVDEGDYPKLRWQRRLAGDSDDDLDVDLGDLSGLSASWMCLCDPNAWNKSYVAGEPNDLVDLFELRLFARNWLTGLAPMGHWTFDTDYTDCAGGYNSMAVGNPMVVPDARVGAGAVALEGSDMIEVIGFKGVGGALARSCMAWIKTEAEQGCIVWWGNKEVVGGMWDLRVSATGGLRVQVRGGGYIESVAKVNTGDWVHVAAVLPPGGESTEDILLYINGVCLLPEGTTLSSDAVNTIPSAYLYIGGDDREHYFTGMIDDVRVYSRALTAEEIAELAK